jgi:hypothetical protein
MLRFSRPKSDKRACNSSYETGIDFYEGYPMKTVRRECKDIDYPRTESRVFNLSASGFAYRPND